MNITNTPFSNQSVESVTIFTLLLIILLCFLKYIFFKDNTEKKGVQKIIGGLSVFIVALLSHDIFVQMVSLFIGGLIIASEEFMQNLAIIVRSQSGDIGKNLSLSHPTQAEIEEKKQRAVHEVKRIDITKGRFTPRYNTITVESLENVENQMSQYFQNKYGNSYEQNIKISSPNGYDFVADGVVKDEDGGIQEIIEIKHIPDLKFAEKALEQSIKYLQPLSAFASAVICFVVDEKPLESTVLNLYNTTRNYKNITLGVFVIKNQILKPILVP